MADFSEDIKKRKAYIQQQYNEKQQQKQEPVQVATPQATLQSLPNIPKLTPLQAQTSQIQGINNQGQISTQTMPTTQGIQTFDNIMNRNQAMTTFANNNVSFGTRRNPMSNDEIRKLGKQLGDEQLKGNELITLGNMLNRQDLVQQGEEKIRNATNQAQIFVNEYSITPADKRKTDILQQGMASGRGDNVQHRTTEITLNAAKPLGLGLYMKAKENLQQDAEGRKQALDELGITNPVARAALTGVDAVGDVANDIRQMGANAYNNTIGKLTNTNININTEGSNVLDQDKYRTKTEQEVAKSVDNTIRDTIKRYGGNPDSAASKFGKGFGNIMKLLLTRTMGLSTPAAFAASGATEGYERTGDLEGAITGGIKGYTTGKAMRVLSPGIQSAGQKILSATNLNTNTAMQALTEVIATFLSGASGNAVGQVADIMKADPNGQYINWNEIPEGLSDEDKAWEIAKQIMMNRTLEAGSAGATAAIYNLIGQAVTGFSGAKNRTTTLPARVTNASAEELEKAYKELGLKGNESLEEVKRAYKQLVRQTHPDIFDNEAARQAANDKLATINVAYETIEKAINGTPISTTPVEQPTQEPSQEGIVVQNNTPDVANEANNMNLGAYGAMMAQQAPANTTAPSTTQATNINGVKNDFSSASNESILPKNEGKDIIQEQNDEPEEILVETNIGDIPVAEYRDIMAQQWGFDDYAQMRREGYKLGDKYDIDIKDIETPKQTSSLAQANEALKEQQQNKAKQAANTLANKTKVEKYNAKVDKMVAKAEEQAPIEKVETVAEAKETEKAPVVASAKVQQYVNRARNNFTNNLIDDLQITKKGNKDILTETTNEIVENIQNGTLEIQKQHELFNKLYKELVTMDKDFYEEHKDLKKWIKDTKLYIPEELKKQITDYNDFRKSNMGKLILTSDRANLSVDRMYQQLTAAYPGLFPEDIVTEADQLDKIAEVQNQIAVVERNLEGYADKTLGPEYRKWAEESFDKRVGELKKKINDAKNYSQDKVAEIERKNNLLNEQIDKESIKELYKAQKEAQAKYTKVANKELLTRKDKAQVDRLLKREIDINELPKGVNKEGIIREYQAKQELDAINDAIDMSRKTKRIQREDRAKELIKNIDKWKDKPAGIQYSTEIAERNIEDIAGEDAKAINKEYFETIHKNEANSIRQRNEIKARIDKYGLNDKEIYKIPEKVKAKILETLPDGEVLDQEKVSEYGLVQLLGEGYIDKQGIEALGADANKIEAATEEFRKIYNELFEQANDALLDSGYKPVEYRKDYFPHFSEQQPDTILRKVASKIGIDLNKDTIPTDISGLTHNFRPGKKWVANFLQRKGNKTYFDAAKGMDRYLSGALDVIHHTGDIQNLRALERAIRQNFSTDEITKAIQEIQDDTTLTEEERTSRLNELFNRDTTHMNNFVKWLRRYTDDLAGKKAFADRDIEQELSRSVYSVMKNVNGRVASNMIGGNLGSAITNFIPLAQSSGEITTGSMLKALRDVAFNAGKKDGFVDRSDFLTNRRGTDNIYSGKFADKLSKAAGRPMEAIDEFTSETIVRGKYYDNLANGMSEDEAMDNANKFAARVMADRSKGALPTIFNSQNPVNKLFTAFQVEVNNQFRYLFKDLPKNVKEEANNNLVKALFSIFVSSYLMGEVYEKLTGRRIIFDPINIVQKTVEGYQKEGISGAAKELGEQAGENTPFIGGVLFDGGRIPISSAMPSLSKLGQAVFATDDDGNLQADWKTIRSELSKPFYYLVFPTGGGQLKKTAEAAETLIKGGSYSHTKSGDRLRFATGFDEMSTPEKFLRSAQALTFGKYALPNARDYVENGFQSLSVSATDKFKEATEHGIKSGDFLSAYNAQKGITGDKDEDGKTIQNSASRNKVEAIKEAVPDLSKSDKLYLYEMFNVGKTVIEEEKKKK